eukprot:Partr_v1_DN24709_c0_g1_i1_m37446 putative retinoblastoma binding protein
MTLMDEQEVEKQINDEYKVWKKNSPFLYDLLVTHAFEWPTLTMQFLPDVTVSGDHNIHRIITGTHTSDGEQNYLNIVSCVIPNSDSTIDSRAFDDQTGEVSTFSNKSKLTTVQSIPHDGEINRARYMPQNPCLIATRAVDGDVYVFDYTKHPSKATDLTCRPDLKLKGLSKEGYGLSWNSLRKGQVVACSEDGAVCLWDLEGYTRDQRELPAVHTFHCDTVVEDVAFHSLHDSIFASVGDDSMLNLWDTRTYKKAHSVKAHAAEVNCVGFNPFSEYILATGGSDRVVNLWDIRNISAAVHTLTGHQDEVLQLQWSPHNETVLASASADRRLNVYELSRIGQELSEEEAEDGPAELLFVHGGHTSKISDFDWDKNEPWLIGSAAEDNVGMVWQMSSNIYAGDEGVEVSSDMVE